MKAIIQVSQHTFLVADPCLKITQVLPPSEPTTGTFHSDRQKGRYSKRKAMLDSLSKTREELFAGEFDGYVAAPDFFWRFVDLSLSFSFSLVVASEYEPFSIVEKLTPYLSCSAAIVVYSPNVQVSR